MKPFLLALAVAVLLSSCTGTPRPNDGVCSPQELLTYTTQVEELARRFNDAVQVASATPRMALAPMIVDLQAVRRDAQALEVDTCAADVHDALVDYMDATINLFLAFLGQQSTDQADRDLRSATARFAEALLAVKMMEETK
jgi:hypothetical protein